MQVSCDGSGVHTEALPNYEKRRTAVVQLSCLVDLCGCELRLYGLTLDAVTIKVFVDCGAIYAELGSDRPDGLPRLVGRRELR